jgi:hypothetical protein
MVSVTKSGHMCTGTLNTIQGLTYAFFKNLKNKRNFSPSLSEEYLLACYNYLWCQIHLDGTDSTGMKKFICLQSKTHSKIVEAFFPSSEEVSNPSSREAQCFLSTIRAL